MISLATHSSLSLKKASSSRRAPPCVGYIAPPLGRPCRAYQPPQRSRRSELDPVGHLELVVEERVHVVGREYDELADALSAGSRRARRHQPLAHLLGGARPRPRARQRRREHRRSGWRSVSACSRTASSAAESTARRTSRGRRRVGAAEDVDVLARRLNGTAASSEATPPGARRGRSRSRCGRGGRGGRGGCCVVAVLDGHDVADGRVGRERARSCCAARKASEPARCRRPRKRRGARGSRSASNGRWRACLRPSR